MCFARLPDFDTLLFAKSAKLRGNMGYPLFLVDEATERVVLGELLDYCEHLTGMSFDHNCMGAGEALTILLSDFGLARETGTGFSHLLSGEIRETFISAMYLETLPCLEDLIDVCLSMATQYDTSPHI